MSESKSKWNVVLEGEGLQDKNQEFSAIIFQLQRADLTELKLSKGMYQIWHSYHMEIFLRFRLAIILVKARQSDKLWTNISKTIL